MKFIKRNASAIISIALFVLGVVSKLFRKDKPAHTDMILTVDRDQVESMLQDGGSVIFKDVYVNGRVRVIIGKEGSQNLHAL